MATRSIVGGEAQAFKFPTKYREKEKNGERTKVPVVYYLSKNGQLEHPHFMEVPLASTQGLYLRDIINRLNVLRGKGMASLYSWSSKRSYKNGYVWHDLSENDFVYPSHGEEYVLKGSEIVESPSSYSSGSSGRIIAQNTERHSDFAVATRRNKQSSWDSIDDLKPESTEKVAADASTQTITRAELNGGEKEDVLFSPPPPSSSSAETLEKCDESANICNPKAKNYPSGRSKASAVLMQLISCGSVTVNDENPTITNQGNQIRNSPLGPVDHRKSRFNGVEDKEYFSGSLIETRKDEFAALKRSSSCNADRGSKFEMVGNEREEEEEVEEMEGGRFKCIPRKSIKREDDSLVCNSNRKLVV